MPTPGLWVQNPNDPPILIELKDGQQTKMSVSSFSILQKGVEGSVGTAYNGDSIVAVKDGRERRVDLTMYSPDVLPESDAVTVRSRSGQIRTYTSRNSAGDFTVVRHKARNATAFEVTAIDFNGSAIRSVPATPTSTFATQNWSGHTAQIPNTAPGTVRTSYQYPCMNWYDPRSRAWIRVEDPPSVKKEEPNIKQEPGSGGGPQQWPPAY